MIEAPSDREGILPFARQKAFARKTPSLFPAPQMPTSQEASVLQEEPVADRGRPRHAESVERRKQFVRLVLAGSQLKAAAVDSQIQPLRALAILDELAALRVVEIDPQEEAA